MKKILIIRPLYCREIITVGNKKYQVKGQFLYKDRAKRCNKRVKGLIVKTTRENGLYYVLSEKDAS